MTRSTHAWFASVLLGAGCVHRSPNRPADSPRIAPVARPILALYETSVFGQGGANLTRFVLYDDGEALWARGNVDEYRWSRLSAEELRSFVGALKISEFFALDDEYDLFPEITCVPTLYIALWAGDRHKKVGVRGATAQYSDGRKPPTPTAFARILESTETLEKRSSRTWLPDSIYVGLAESERSDLDKPTLEWPSDWPDLMSPGAVRPAGNAQGHLTLPGEYWPEARALEKRGRYLRIDGKRYWFYVALSIPAQRDWFGSN